MYYKECFKKLPIIETEHLLLRQITDSLDEGYQSLEFINDFEVYKFWGFYDIESKNPAPLPIQKDPLFLYKTNMDNFKNQYELNWSIFCKEDGHLIGEIILFNFQGDKQAEIGYRLARKYWNKGYITEAGKAILKLVFEDFCFLRLDLRCHKINSASQHLAEKLGFNLEGLVHKGFLIEHFADYYIFGLTSEDYFKIYNHNTNNLFKTILSNS